MNWARLLLPPSSVFFSSTKQQTATSSSDDMFVPKQCISSGRIASGLGNPYGSEIAPHVVTADWLTDWLSEIFKANFSRRLFKELPRVTILTLNEWRKHNFIGMEYKGTYFDNRDVADSFIHLPHQITNKAWTKPIVFKWHVWRTAGGKFEVSRSIPRPTQVIAAYFVFKIESIFLSWCSRISKRVSLWLEGRKASPGGRPYFWQEQLWCWG